MTDSTTSAGELREVRFDAGPKMDEVLGLLWRPATARWLLVLAHGAGAGMEHVFMNGIARCLAERSVATLRFQFPYMQAGRRRPDPAPVLEATIAAAMRHAGEIAGDLPLLAGGKSLGGRMTSRLAAASPLPRVHGLVFFGFPLHPPKRPATERAVHLPEVPQPMLFLQGTRDDLADLDLLRPICAELSPRATLHVVDGADHSFHVLKRSGRTDDEVLEEIADATLRWVDELPS
jgi:predicted alpha/beta-hydrolase family hydrolase